MKRAVQKSHIYIYIYPYGSTATFSEGIWALLAPTSIVSNHLVRRYVFPQGVFNSKFHTSRTFQDPHSSVPRQGGTSPLTCCFGGPKRPDRLASQSGGPNHPTRRRRASLGPPRSFSHLPGEYGLGNGGRRGTATGDVNGNGAFELDTGVVT